MKVLNRIQKKASRKFHNKLFKVQRKNKEIIELYEVLLTKDIPNWKRDYYKQTIRELDGEETVLDEEVAKEQDEFIDNLIKKAVEDGKLPDTYVKENNTNSEGGENA